jgi:CRISPR-associated endonuclease/helicase Cas3
VPATYGGCDEFGWTPIATAPVVDLGDQRSYSLMAVRRLHPSLQPELWDRLAPIVDRDNDLGQSERLQALATEEVIALDEAWKIFWPDGYRGVVLVGLRRTPNAFAAATEDDASGSLTSVSCELSAHREAVANMARRFAASSGLSRSRIEDLALAALLHDEGKADPRFQVWLRGGDRITFALAGEEVLAKSSVGMTLHESRAARIEAGLPDRWRHEAQSVRRAIGDPRLGAAEDAELVLWLIGTHHGHGRPLFPHHDPQEVPDGLGPQRLDFQFQGYDWPQMYEHLKSRYGLWELARMEAVLRLADHRASAEASI